MMDFIEISVANSCSFRTQASSYNVFYIRPGGTSRINNVIYILHCFEKQSRKTDRRDLETAKERLTRVRHRIQQQMKGSKDVRKN